MRKLLLTVLVGTGYALAAQQVKLNIKEGKTLLNIPIQESAPMDTMRFFQSDSLVKEINIRVAHDSAEYWVFADLADYIGQSLMVEYPGSHLLLDEMYLDDEIAGADSLYKEKNRPQFHFSTMRGWNNDPNGMVYYDGEYHLFYQHNPYGIWWQNMHWGHAVSTDLLHWRELPTALHPDDQGVMFSGSAVIDKENTSGFKTGPEDVMVAIYTTFKPEFNGSPLRSFQSVAYSNDRGRTFTKYEGNPVLDTQTKWKSGDVRDPKVFWHQLSEQWVMVLFEKLSLTFYTSDNLKDWEYQSKVGGFWECPELFELPVDGDKSNKKWVLIGASGTYMIGRFDGRQFVTETDKLKYIGGEFFAAQTFNNTPDDRRIQIGWARIHQYGMPFNQMMAFPTSLSLRTTREGIRLFSEPVGEIDQLHEKSYKWDNLTLAEANQKLSAVQSDYLHLKMTVKQVSGAWFKFRKDGEDLFDYNLSHNTLNGQFYGGDNIENLTFEIEVLADKTSAEIFMDNGKFSLVRQLGRESDNSGLRFESGGETLIERLEVYELESIWPE